MAEYLFAIAEEADVNSLLSGKLSGNPMPWDGRRPTLRLPRGTVGVLWKAEKRLSDTIRPLLLAVRSDEAVRLFGRFAQLRSDLSPLSAWCHVVPLERFESLDSLVRDADLGGYDAAWSALAIAEAALLSRRGVSKLKLAACLATQSFAVARAKAVWPLVSSNEIVNRYNSAHGLIQKKAADFRVQRIRAATEVIWTVLSAAAFNSAEAGWLRPLVHSVRALDDERRRNGENEWTRLLEPLLSIVPEVNFANPLDLLTPEERLREFDRLTSLLNSRNTGADSLRQHALCLLAGYLSTVAAGGAPSLSLAEEISDRAPEILAWAYVVGSVGERVTWTSSFDGLGRFVSRELLRPMRLDEAPICDFSLEEAVVLHDSQLADPLVHLRIKQSRAVTISLLPGVNIPFSLVEVATSEDAPRHAAASAPSQAKGDVLDVLADALWPLLRDRMRAGSGRSASARESRSPRPDSNRGAKKGLGQPNLPLREPDESEPS